MSAHRTSRSAALALAAALATAATAIVGAQSPKAAGSSSQLAFSIAWTITVESPLVASPSWLGTRVFVPLKTGGIVALARETGVELWRAPLLAAHATAADQGRVFVDTIDALVAIDASTGGTIWQIPLKGVAAAPIAHAGWVLVGLDSGDLLAIRAADGRLVWRTSLGAPLRSAPAIEGDRTYAALGDDSLVALDIVTGKLVWRTTLPAAAGAITTAGDRIFVGSRDNFLYAIDARNGRQRWRWRTGADVPFAAAFDQSRVYFVSLDNLLRALNFHSGSLEWRHVLDTRPIAAPVVTGDRVMVAGLGAELRVVSAKDGTLLGKWTAPAELSGAPLLFSAADATFVRAIVVTGEASGGWRLHGVAPAGEPLPRALTEIPGRPLPPDAPPVPRGSRRPTG